MREDGSSGSTETESIDLERQLGDYFSELEIKEEFLDQEVAEQPSHFVYYARIAAISKRNLMFKQLELRRFEAIQSKKLRDKYMKIVSLAPEVL